MMAGKYGQTKSALSIFFAKQKQLQLFNTLFEVGTLKPAFMPNFSHIGEVRWPQFFEKDSKVTDYCS